MAFRAKYYNLLKSRDIAVQGTVVYLDKAERSRDIHVNKLYAFEFQDEFYRDEENKYTKPKFFNLLKHYAV